MQSLTTELFNQVASEYDEVLPFFFGFAAQLIDWLNLQASQSVLDLGAGSGALSVLAVQKGCSVTAIDASPEMVKRLSVLSSGIRASVMDMQVLTFPDSVFDAAMAGFSFHLVNDPVRVAAEVFRVLKPGGTFMYSVPAMSDNDTTFDFFARLQDEFRPYADQTRLFAPHSGSLQQALEQAGFTGIASRHAEVNIPCPDTGTFWRWFMSHGSRNFHDALPVDKQGEYKVRVYEEIDRNPDKVVRRGAMFWRCGKPRI